MMGVLVAGLSAFDRPAAFLEKISLEHALAHGIGAERLSDPGAGLLRDDGRHPVARGAAPAGLKLRGWQDSNLLPPAA